MDTSTPQPDSPGEPVAIANGSWDLPGAPAPIDLARLDVAPTAPAVNQVIVLDDLPFSLDALERIEAELAAVDRAIERIDAGTFGRCEVCAATIRAEAMAVDPLTARCDAHPDQLRAIVLQPV